MIGTDQENGPFCLGIIIMFMFIVVFINSQRCHNADLSPSHIHTGLVSAFSLPQSQDAGTQLYAH